MCRDFTGGPNCDKCAEGYFGDPLYNAGCQPCPCPETNRNFARGCTVYNKRVNCICRPGYTGALCDKCMLGWYGNTDGLNGKCLTCDCDPDGVVSNECDELTGQCNCKPGITGRRCDRCNESRYILQDRECRCKFRKCIFFFKFNYKLCSFYIVCDNCTILLLDRAELIRTDLKFGVDHIDANGIPAPWPQLEKYENESHHLSHVMKDFNYAKNGIQDFNEAIIEKVHNTFYGKKGLEKT